MMLVSEFAVVAHTAWRALGTRKGRDDLGVSVLSGASAAVIPMLAARCRQGRSRDALTGMPNRCVLERRLVVLFDLDRFKLVNDTQGYRSGDRVLRDLGARLRSGARPGEVIGRWGGEEFLCVLPGADAERARAIAERLRYEIARVPSTAGRTRESISASFGIASYPQHGDSIDALLGRADMALYRAKSDGRDRVVVARADGRGLHFVATQIVKALDAGSIRVAFQPIVDLASGVHDGSVFPAGGFIDVAEDLHLAHRIDAVVLPQVLQRARRRQGLGERPLLQFVNVTPQIVQHPNDVAALIGEWNALAPAPEHSHAIVLEITERVGLRDFAALKAGLAPFLALGCQLAIDDFGSGIAPLQYLAELPVSYIKFDGDLVAGVHEARVRSIIRSIVSLAAELRITTIAEGVEREDSVAVLRELGVRWAQGYLFGRPVLARSESDDHVAETA